MSDTPYEDGFWESPDGLKLHYRDYPGGGEGRPALLCLPGLTRNARDFEPIAEAFAGDWRVICVEFRGRGESDYAKDTSTYVPLAYATDVAALLEQAGLDNVVLIGTSLGGIVATLLHAQVPERIAGVVLNDIGPAIEPAGLARIREYVGQGRSFPTWMHAARALKEQAGGAHPDFTTSEWLRLTKRLMCIGQSGRIAFDYDMRIAEPFAESGEGGDLDMWPLFKGLEGKPALLIRGELSDILSADVAARMVREIPGLKLVTIARTGHAPTLDEPEALAAIAALLGEVA